MPLQKPVATEQTPAVSYNHLHITRSLSSANQAWNGLDAKGVTGPATAARQAENNTLNETVVGLEPERDFNFSKLSGIELVIQQTCLDDPDRD